MLHDPSRTQIRRTRVSVPTTALLAAGLIDGGRVLHVGEGWAWRDSAAMRATGALVRSWDPFSPCPMVRTPIDPGASWDVVVATYVLNVLPPAERAVALAGIVARGGRALVSVRTDPVTGTPHEDGVLTSRGTFQTSYTRARAEAEIGPVVLAGSGFVTCTPTPLRRR